MEEDKYKDRQPPQGDIKGDNVSNDTLWAETEGAGESPSGGRMKRLLEPTQSEAHRKRYNNAETPVSGEGSIGSVGAPARFSKDSPKLDSYLRSQIKEVVDCEWEDKASMRCKGTLLQT